MSALSSTIAKIASASYGSAESRSYSHKAAEISAAMISRTTRTSVNWAKNFRQAETGFSAASSFLP